MVVQTMKNYLNIYKKPTPQSEPLPGTAQIPNSAGGYVWQISPWERLNRFLILGSEGGSYYATERTLTVENAQNLLKCIEEDGERVVNIIVEISDSGRAPKNDPAIFALALTASVGSPTARKAALDALPKVCRIGTHLFSFAEYIKGMRGWGRGLRNGIAGWYKGLKPAQLAYQTVKYRQRNGWTHADLIRLAHPKPESEIQEALFKWITRREEVTWGDDPPSDEAMAFLWAFERVQKEPDRQTVLALIRDYDLPREALPTPWLNDPAIWEALLESMPMTAMIRNLGVMSRVGLLVPHSAAETTIVERLTDQNRLHKARIHPISILSAMKVYKLGYSLRGGERVGFFGYGYRAPSKKEWTPTARVMDALDSAFELSFQAITPTHKRIMLALDISGSMAGGMIAGVPGLTPRDGSGAMAMVTARTERNYSVISFQNQIVPLNISAKMRFDDVIKTISGLPMGATDCAQPMLYALQHKLDIDAFIVYTDSETWIGSIHPVNALRDYREKRGIHAQLIVVGMVANHFSIADPDDTNMLDVVGFDTAAPQVMADFMRGTL